MIHRPLWLPLDIARDLGWTLIHFLWQGMVLASLLYMILPMCRSATARHNWALGTLAIMAFVPVTTFLFIHEHGGSGVLLVAASGAAPQGMAIVADILAPTSIPSSWVDWLVVLWFAGLTVLGLRALGGWYLTETWRRCDTLVLPPVLLQRCHALQRRLAITWQVTFLQSRRVSVPIVIGWFRPVVLLPISVITGLPPQQLDALILHELAHIRRLDAFTNVMLITIETILFYHPAVWWVSRRVRIEREHCCDDFAVSICGDAAIYVEALTSLERWKAVPTPALAANGGKLRERVARLLGNSSDPRGFSRSAIVGLVFVCLCLTLGWMVRGVTTYNPALETVASYQDWRTACPAAQDKNKSCEMIQDVRDVVLKVGRKSHSAVARVSLTQDNGQQVIGFTMPFGVLLQPGISLQVGKDPIKVYHYRTCISAGCVAVAPLDDKLVTSLTDATEVRVFVSELDSKPVAIPVSLKGFDNAYRAYESDQARRTSWFWRLWS